MGETIFYEQEIPGYELIAYADPYLDLKEENRTLPLGIATIIIDYAEQHGVPSGDIAIRPSIIYLRQYVVYKKLTDGNLQNK